MPTVAELLGKRAEVVVKFPAGELNVAYRPEVWTRPFERRLETMLTSAAEADSDNDELLGMLSTLLIDWDLIDEETGEPYELTPEGLDRVPKAVMAVVLRLLVERIATGEAIRASSSSSPAPSNSLVAPGRRRR